MLGRRVIRPIEPASQRIILKIVRFIGWFRPIDLLRVQECPVLVITILCWPVNVKILCVWSLPKINVIFLFQYSLMVILQNHVNTTIIQQPGAQYLLITYIKYLPIHFSRIYILIDLNHFIVAEFLTSILLDVNPQ